MHPTSTVAQGSALKKKSSFRGGEESRRSSSAIGGRPPSALAATGVSNSQSFSRRSLAGGPLPVASSSGGLHHGSGSMYRRPSSAMTALRPDTPAIVPKNSTSPNSHLGGGATSGSRRGTINYQRHQHEMISGGVHAGAMGADNVSPVVSPMASPSGSPTLFRGGGKRLMSIDSDSDQGGLMMSKNLSFRSLFGESLLANDRTETNANGGATDSRKRSVFSRLPSAARPKIGGTTTTSSNNNHQTTKRATIVNNRSSSIINPPSAAAVDKSKQKKNGKPKGSNISSIVNVSNPVDSLVDELRNVERDGEAELEHAVEEEEERTNQILHSSSTNRGNGSNVGFRRVGLDATGKVVRQDLTTNLFWRECLNDAAVHRELVLYNYIMSHSDGRRSTSNSGGGNPTNSHHHHQTPHHPLSGAGGAGHNNVDGVSPQSASFAPWSLSAQQRVDTDMTIQVGSRTVDHAPDFSSVPLRIPAINVDHILTLEGNDQRYVSVTSNVAASDATTKATGLHLSVVTTTTSSSSALNTSNLSTKANRGGTSMTSTSAALRTSSASRTRFSDSRTDTVNDSISSSSGVVDDEDSDGLFASKKDLENKVMFRVVPFLLTEKYEMTLEEACKTPGKECPGAALLKWLKEVANQLAYLHQIGMLHNITTADTIVLSSDPHTLGNSNQYTNRKQSTTSSSFVGIAGDDSSAKKAMSLLSAKLSNMSCCTVFEEKRLIDLAPFTMRQQRAQPTTSQFHSLPLTFLPSRVHNVPPEWLVDPAEEAAELEKQMKKRISRAGGGGGAAGSDFDGTSQQRGGSTTQTPPHVGFSSAAANHRHSVLMSTAYEPSRRRTSALLGKLSSFTVDTIAVLEKDDASGKRHSSGGNPFANWRGNKEKVSPLKMLVDSNRRVVPGKPSDSYFFGKLLSYIFFAQGTSGGSGANSGEFGGNTQSVTFKTNPVIDEPPIIISNPMTPAQAAALAARAAAKSTMEFPLNPNITGIPELGMAELKHLIECLVRKQPGRRWLLEHAAAHPFFWTPPVIRSFIGLILQYVGSTDGKRRPSLRSSRSTTTTTLAKRKRRCQLSHDLTVWVTSPVQWLPRVQDWYDAICRDNHEGIRYDYENSVEDQLEFFVNVYEHLVKYKTQTICNGDAGTFARLFVHDRFPGLLHTLAVRVLADQQDEEQVVSIMESQTEAASLNIQNSTIFQSGAFGGGPVQLQLPQFAQTTDPTYNNNSNSHHGNHHSPPALGGGGGFIAPDSHEVSGNNNNTAAAVLDPLGVCASADPAVTSDLTLSTVDSFVRRLALDLREQAM